MPLIVWSDELSVGIKEFDKDHRQLVGMVNELHDAVVNGQAEGMMGFLLHDLGQYTQTHFKAEEAAFDACGYSNGDAHKADHERLLKELEIFRTSYDSNGLSPEEISEVNVFLERWFCDHMQQFDMEYKDELSALEAEAAE